MSGLTLRVIRYGVPGLGSLLLFFASFGQIAEIRQLQSQLPGTRDSLQYVDVLNRIGLLIHMKNADSCFYYSVRAKSMADRLNYTKGQGDAFNNIAAALFLKGLYSQALGSFSKALSAYKKIDDIPDVAQMLMNSAITYSAAGNNPNAIQFSRKALNEAGGLAAYGSGNDSIMSMLYANFDNLNPGLSEDSSRNFLQKAEQIAVKYKDERVLLFLKQIKAEKLLDKKKGTEALPYILQSLDMAKRNQWEYHEIEGLDLYGSYFMAKDDIDSAIECYNRMYSLALANGYGYMQSQVLQSLLNCYEIKNDEPQELKLNKLLVNALGQDNENNKSFIGDYIQYNTAQEQVKQLEVINKKNNRKIALLAGLCLLSAVIIIIIFLLYKMSRRHSRTQAILHEKISAQNELLQQSDEFKATLISMLAHDFRSPLNSVLSMVSLLDSSAAFNKEELPRIYRSIDTEVRNILLTFDNILNWIKKQLSGYVFHPEFLTVHELVDESASMFRDQAAAKQIKFQNKVATTLVLHSDKEIVQFVNRNLIHNALKFSPMGGTITVTARRDNKEIIVAVRDEGKGVSKEQAEKLFSFTDSKNGVDKGAGIALTISKEFIHKLGGRIWVESHNGQEGMSQGSKFIYALPI